MITRQNLHMHTRYDDGVDSCENMLLACQRAGLTSGGISLHSPLSFDSSWTADPERIDAYLSEMDNLKNRFQDTFTVFTGIEWDVLSTDLDLSPYDYVIGSVHFIAPAGIPVPVDDSPDTLLTCIREDLGMDGLSAAQLYFSELHKVADAPQVQICGHFDLITKFNESCPFLDTSDSRYIRAARDALDHLISAGKIFEVNTGAQSRGWRSSPYPEERWLRQIHEMGGRVLLSSDAHRTEHVVSAFDEAEQLLRACGFTEVVSLTKDGTWSACPLLI